MKMDLARGVRVAVVLLLAGAAGRLTGGEPASPDWRTVNVIQTNSTTRFVTNVIEVRVPENVFVDEYRTNHFRRTLTNIVVVPVTNWSTRTLTNFVPVVLVRTNVVERRQTNWATVTRTNQTTVTRTNWETVRVLKTNWITQPVTNVIEAIVPPGAITAMAREPISPPVAAAEMPASSFIQDILVIETTRTSQPADSWGAEVDFKVRSATNPELLLQVQQWRVEREDRAVLVSSQAQEFKRALPPGRYQVLVRARRNLDGPLLAQQIVVDVTKDAVTRR
jgi:hypothetical protein